MVLSGRPSIMGSNSLTFNACFLGPTTIGAAESWRTGGTSMVSLVCSLALRGGSGVIPLSSPNVTKCITRTKISMSLGGCTTITQRSVGKPSCRDREMSVSRYQISLWQIRRFSFRPGLCEAASNSPAVAQLEQESVPLKASGEDQATEFQKIRQYPFPEIEAKWQSLWEEQKTFCTPDAVDTSKPKFYALDMFPYPSGAGLHVGHPEGYTATDIIARYKRMRGFNVLHPIGWDAFGLPAEQYAIQTGTHPRETTLKNIDRFRCQLKSLGFSYDWQREISTAEPDYYKWTQWIFLQLFNRGLAYQAEVPVNWCPALATVLANEEVIDGLSERGGYPVIRKPMMQWVLRITAYADRLLEDLDELDWPESIKEMQRNWIGRSEGAEINFEIVGDAGSESSMTLRVFTTRPDTICGATYLVIAPEHPLLHDLVSKQQKTAVDQYVEAAKRKSDLERTELQKKKSGIFTGTSATNPATGEAIPVWVADYVLGSYGTGAIMAVPAHDSRDYEFAKSFNLPMRVVICSGKDLESHDEVYSGDGTMINSSHTSVGVHLDGLPNTEAASTVTEWLQQRGQGNKQVNYKLRDWLFARQRYWGEPFPIIFVDGASTPRAVSESGLPIRLPNIEDFTPAENGEPPLAKAASWVNTIDEETGKRARRETNTMPQWAGSCWYYLRFMDPKNSKQLVSPEKERYWGPVDLYVGGAEHSVLHLLYARFWHKVLFDIGVVSTKEPFQCLVNQGMILGQIEYTTYQRADGVYISADEADEDCEPQRVSENEVMKSGDSYILKSDESVRVSARAHKMSKSRGNVINPEDVIRDFGADSLRLYEMFMGPLRDTKVWSTSGVEGVYRFLGRSWRVFVGVPLQGESCPTGSSLVTDSTPSDEQLKAIHRCIQKVTDDIEGLRFNTAISSMMEFINAAIKWNSRPRSVLEPFILLLAPFAPHVAEELWHRVGHSKSLAYEPWPEANSLYLKDESVILPVQINGKMRGKVQVPADADEETARAVVIKSGDFDKFLDGKSIKKTIFVSGRILNFVVK